MAWMVVSKECNWSRPDSKFSFNAKPSRRPQRWPRGFVDYCVSVGRAVEQKPPNKAEAEKLILVKPWLQGDKNLY